MVRLLVLLIASSLVSFWAVAQHPTAFIKKEDAKWIKANINKYPLLKNSFNDIKAEVDFWVGKDVDVPFPKDPAGGYTHDKHKANYMLMFNSGLLYNITGEAKYALLVKNMFLKYAKLNPTLGKHPEATSSSPGRIFWQALNDANWLVYTGLAYDLIYNTLTPAERTEIENGAFKPEVEFITQELQWWFDLIHNHAVWACAGVGIVGIATNNEDYIQKALYGSKKDGRTGFFALMDGLFSPDGYYTEGPYYVRYAILPYYLLAASVQNAKPALKVFEHRDRILYKALEAGLQQTNMDGTFFAFNDAMKEKDYTTNELVTAINIATDVYGKNDALLFVANKQGKVTLSKGGVQVAKYIHEHKKMPSYFPYQTKEYVDGKEGNKGGISFLRTGKDNKLSTLIFKYTAHGLSHGHYDKLNINFFDKGNEIITDYGAVRYIGVEQKNGGRYLPETKKYAMQTIAHNTIVVDETSHFKAIEDTAELFASEKLFSDIYNEKVQAIAAKEVNAYKEKQVQLKRGLYSIQIPGGNRMIVDLFTTQSVNAHQFDLPFHYSGQLIHSTIKYKAHTTQQETLGKKNGYQYLWKTAEAFLKDTLVQLTFLNNKTYYTISQEITAPTDLYFVRTGAGDPNYNLRSEPGFVFRKKGVSPSFVSVIEVHGQFDPVAEFSTGAYPSVEKISTVINNEQYTVVELIVRGKKLVVAQSNKDYNANSQHHVNGINWKGAYTVIYDGLKISN